jgi:hypothetical protein
MAIAVSERGCITVTVQEAFRLRNYNQDITLNDDGHSIIPMPSLMATIAELQCVSRLPLLQDIRLLPVAKVFNFPQQHYSDKISMARCNIVDYPNAEMHDDD